MTTCETAAPLHEKNVDLSNYFNGINSADATFVVYHPASREIIRHNQKRATQRFVPASTFKIPNALIALEAGVASGADHLIQWDENLAASSGFWSASWSKDHTLHSAMRDSAYWYYQALARSVGAEKMQRYLNQLHYGNRSMGGGLDRFWLHGDLRISADEQVWFLERMYRGELGLRKSTTQVVKSIIVLEDHAAYRLSGKTGTADLTPTRELAWLVGYVERDGDVWFYALNMEGEQVWELWGKPSIRLALVRSMLRELKIIPVE